MSRPVLPPLVPGTELWNSGCGLRRSSHSFLLRTISPSPSCSPPPQQTPLHYQAPLLPPALLRHHPSPCFLPVVSRKHLSPGCALQLGKPSLPRREFSPRPCRTERSGHSWTGQVLASVQRKDTISFFQRGRKRKGRNFQPRADVGSCWAGQHQWGRGARCGAETFWRAETKGPEPQVAVGCVCRGCTIARDLSGHHTGIVSLLGKGKWGQAAASVMF